MDDHQKSLEIAEKIGDRGSKAKSSGNLGLAYQSLGQYQKAIDSLRKVFSHHEGYRPSPRGRVFFKQFRSCSLLPRRVRKSDRLP
ncbi:MAG UNVERIFIED_CONTAM: tetratricopeptide repeat protein [Microcystis novacekii LVE1205-3]